MIRYLCGLNPADALKELQLLGITRANLQELEGIRENLSFKVSGIFREKSSEIRQFLGKFKEAAIIAQPDEYPQSDFIFYFPPAAKKKFQQRLLRRVPDELSGFAEALQMVLENIFREQWDYSLPGGGQLLIDHPLIMGILNVTPDSFSDGGRFFDSQLAQQHATGMLAAGADIIDIGGESTRPGSERVSVEEEWNRVAPVLRYLAKLDHSIVSIDTHKSEIARRALAEGAHIINDVSAMTFDPHMAEVAAKTNAPVILMHMQGTPKTMQKSPIYKNLMEEILEHLDQRCRFAVERDVYQLIVDPGIGFGKRVNDNYELIRRLGELHALGYPILLGASRKSFLGNMLDLPPEERLSGTTVATLCGVMQGAKIVRVHDVAEIKQALLVYEAIRENKAT